MSWDAVTIASMVTAAFTAGATVATAVMAYFTRRAIAESHAQSEKMHAQSEQHHQDASRPVLVLAPRSGIDQLDRSNLLWNIPTKPQETTRAFETPCVLRNIGTGPALNVRMAVRFMGIEGYGISREVIPLRAGGETAGTEGHLRMEFRLRDDFNAADVDFAKGLGWEVLLEYEDVFGNAFHTIHRKDPRMPWTECNKGRAPASAV